MHLRILIPAIQLAEIHEESLKDAVHPEIILREIQNSSLPSLSFAGKSRVPNQPADIKNQLIKPAKPMLTKPPQQTFCNTNLLNMRKFCQSLSQTGSYILINSLYPHQSLQGRKDNPVDDYILRKLIYLADGSAVQMLTAFQSLSKIQLATNASTSCSLNRYALKSPWRKSLSQALNKTMDNRFSSEWHFSPSTFTLSSWSLTPQA